MVGTDYNNPFSSLGQIDSNDSSGSGDDTEGGGVKNF